MRSDALTAAREMLPLIMRLRDETESRRCLAAPIVERLIDSRLCRMAIVERLDGLELPTCEMLDVYETLAAAEASVAWIVWNNALPCLFSRYLDDDARAELFCDPAWLYASSTRPSGKAVVSSDGYRVSGRWSLVSGCELAEWIALMCIVEEDGQPRMTGAGVPEMRLVFLRRNDLEILDTWHVGGLRGTGSHDVVVKEKYVPRRLSVAPGDANTLDRPIGRIPIICTMAAGYASQALGVAESAVCTIIELAKTKSGPDPGPSLRDRPAVQALLAKQCAGLEAARDHLRSCAGRLWDSVYSGEAPKIEDISAVWSSALHAVDFSHNVVNGMYAAGGTTSLYTDCPLERAHRDIHAMLRHVVAQPMWLEDAGRVKLGMAPSLPLYAV